MEMRLQSTSLLLSLFYRRLSEETSIKYRGEIFYETEVYSVHT